MLALATQTLAKVEASRLQRAVDGYTTGAYQIRVTRNTDEAIEGFVTNGNGVQYGVALTPHRVFCSCKDSMFRHLICKHATVLALHVIRTPQPPKAQIKPFTSDTFHLKWGNGEVLCQAPRDEKSWLGWTEYMTTWPEACPACVAAYRQPLRLKAAA